MMWSRIAAGVLALLICGLAAIFGHQLITRYGAARYGEGAAEAVAAKAQVDIAVYKKTSELALADRDRIIAADGTAAREFARLMPIVLAANDKVNTYAQSDRGRLPCLAADRVYGIEQDRAALFASTTEDSVGAARSMPASTADQPSGPQPR